jgi:hypothetical protein
MLKRFLIALTFVSAFSFVGVGVTDTAEAWRRWGRPYVSYYGGNYYGGPPAAYYRGYTPYRAYYGPRIYRPYPVYYGGYSDPGYYHYGPQSGVSVSFGF